MLTFTPEDASSRYHDTLQSMEAATIERLAEKWAQVTLAVYFGADQTRAALSCRDTLDRMLVDDRRVLPNQTIDELLDAVTLDQLASDVAQSIYDTYAISTSIG